MIKPARRPQPPTQALPALPALPALQRRALIGALLSTAVLSGAGCFDGQFSGDLDAIRFDSNLGPIWQVWTPAQPIAQGTTIRIDAVDITNRTSDDGITPPLASVTVDESGPLADVVVDVDTVSALAAVDGSTVLRFDSEIAVDTISLEVAAVAGVHFIDPVRAWAESFFEDGAEQFATGDLGDDIDRRPNGILNIAPDASIALGLNAVDADLRRVGITDDAFSVEATNVGAVTGQHLSVITGPALGGEPGVLHLRGGFDGVGGDEVSTDLAVVAVDPADVVALELAFFRGLGTTIKATARLADGSVLWQPPIVWTLPAGLTETDQTELFEELNLAPGPPRRDIVILNEVRDDSRIGDQEVEVIASVGDVESRIAVTLRGEPPSSPAEPTGDATGCGGCQSGSDVAVPAAGLLLLGLRRRRRR